MARWSYQLKHNRFFWGIKLQQRKMRLARLQELNAPEVMLDNERELIRQAYLEGLAWNVILNETVFEIDIVTGMAEIHEATPGGSLMLALLNCSDDDSPEEEAL